MQAMKLYRVYYTYSGVHFVVHQEFQAVSAQHAVSQLKADMEPGLKVMQVVRITSRGEHIPERPE